MTTVLVKIQAEDFDINHEIHCLRQQNKRCGALVTFSGMVREDAEGTEKVNALYLEHYPGMSEKIIEKHVASACKRWPLLDVTVIHRIGKLNVGDNIVLLAVSSEHRKAAFEAAEYIMDFLKTDAPFWKKQITTKGEAWLETKRKDKDALLKWHDSK